MRKRRKKDEEAGELNLTAMIDIAFQMLNFFVITSHPIAVYAHLDILRPTPGAPSQHENQLSDLLTIMVFPDFYAINTKQVSFSQLESVIHQLSALDKNQTVLIQVAAQSEHDKLIAVLDLCAKYKLNNLSVFSM